MSETLIAYGTWNPRTNRSRIEVRQTDAKPHVLSLHKGKKIEFASARESVWMTVPRGMIVIDDPDGVSAADLNKADKKRDLHLYPNQQVTLQFRGFGRVQRTVRVLSGDDYGQRASKALREVKSTRIPLSVAM